MRIGACPALLIAFSVSQAAAQSHVASVTVDGWEPSSLAVYRGGNRLFVADAAGDLVHAFDAATLQPLGTVSIAPIGIAGDMLVDESSGKLYVAPTGNTGSTVAIIDADTLGLIGHRALAGVGTFPSLAADPTIGKIYGLSISGLVQIDTTTDVATVVPNVTSTALSQLAVNPVTHEVFVSRLSAPGTLQIVNGQTFAREAIDGYEAIGIGVNPQMNKVYLTYGLQIHDRDTGMRIPLPNFNDTTSNPVFSVATNRMYTSSEVNAVTSIIDGATDTLVDLPLLRGHGAVAVRPASAHVWYGTDPVIVLDETSQQLYFVPLPEAEGTTLGYLPDAIAVDDTTGRIHLINGTNVEVLQDERVPTRSPLYVGCSDNASRAIFVVDPVLGTTVDTWFAAYPGEQLAIPPGGGRVWLAAPSSDEGLNLVQGYWGTTSAYGPRFASFASGGSQPHAAVFAPDGTRLYVSNRASNTLSIVDPVAQSVVTQVAVGGMPWGLATTSERVYVANRSTASLSVIDRATDSALAPIPVGSAPHGVAAHPAGTRVFVANSQSASVSIVEADTAQVVGTIPVGTTPHWIAISPDGRRGVVSNFGSANATVFDTGTGTVVTTVPLAGNPEGVAFLPDGSRFFVVQSNPTGPSSIASVDAATFGVTTNPLPTNSRSAVAIAIPDPTARFAGRVTARNVALDGAIVQALQGINVAAATTSNASGDYALANLASGTYTLRFAAPGYSEVRRDGLVVGAGRVHIEHVDFTSVVFYDGFESR